jgi:hypothetical protein
MSCHLFVNLTFIFIFAVVDYPEPLITLTDDGQRHNNFSFHNDVLQSDALQLWEGTLPVTDVNQSIENIQHWNRFVF